VAVFFVGAPGAGKTTLVREFLDPMEIYLVDTPKWTVAGNVQAAGHYGVGTHDGGDTVPYDGAARALDYWAVHLRPLERTTLFDGDRFSNEGCLAMIRACTRAAVVVHLHLPGAEAVRRRAQRGSTQAEAWVRGRVTKAARFADKFQGAARLDVDACQPPGTLAAAVRAWVAAQ
jgi:adenylate kinase family enzyme